MRSPLLTKFSILINPYTVIGKVISTEANEIDILPDPSILNLGRLAVFGSVHCEQYAHSGIHSEETNDVPSRVRIGERIAVSGALVLDNVVHGQERREHPERVKHRGLFGLLHAGICKLELHPFWVSSIVHNPKPPIVFSYQQVPLYRQYYITEWFPNRLFCLAGRAVKDSKITVGLEVVQL